MLGEFNGGIKDRQVCVWQLLRAYYRLAGVAGVVDYIGKFVETVLVISLTVVEYFLKR